MHICVDNLTIIGSDNGLSPYRRQSITCTNYGILLIGPLGTNFSEILIKILALSFKKMHLKTSSAKWRSFYLGLGVLKKFTYSYHTLFVAIFDEVQWNWNDIFSKLVVWIIIGYTGYLCITLTVMELYDISCIFRASQEICRPILLIFFKKHLPRGATVIWNW